MKNTIQFIFLLSFLLFSSQLFAQSYCAANGDDNSEEWIADVEISTFGESSAADEGGYYFNENSNIELIAGESYDFTLTPGFADETFDEYWRIYIDYNDDGDFTDANELVYDTENAGSDVINGSFIVPVNVGNSETRIRVIMKYVGDSDLDAPTSCGSFAFGEVEDFSAILINNSDSPSPYCLSSGNSADEWIQTVNIGNLNYTSGNDNGYGKHTDQGTIQLQQATTYSMSLTPGYSGEAYNEYWRIWIDFNKDDDFSDAGELVFDAGGGTLNQLNDNLEISASASLGTTRLRIAMKGLSVNDQAGPNNCEEYEFGETEDYLVNIGPAAGLAPVADFSSNITSGTAPLSVNFFDISTNSPTTWSWSFPGATPNTATSANPTVNYNTAGTYQVSLTASNASGSDTETKTGYITVTSAGAAPVANFSSNVTSGSAPLTVSFFDQSINNPANWTWSFEGGIPATSTLTNPVVTYNTPGVYSVTLTASNAFGSDVESKAQYIVVSQSGSEPIANFTANITSGSGPLTVSFVDQSLNNPTTWNWSFEGGSPINSSEQNPVVTFTNNGTYEVSLTVSNSFGTDAETKTGFITVIDTDMAPIAVFSSNITTGVAPLTVSFFDQSLNEPNSWSWSFPGGTQVNSDAANPVVLYSEPGTYGVTLTVSNVIGSDSESKTEYIVVTDATAAPMAEFGSSIQQGLAPLTVTFFDQSNNDPSSWEWSFPGAVPEISTQQNPTVIYQNPGAFQVSLTASNTIGSDEEIKSGYIIVDANTAVSEFLPALNVKVYPNPIEDFCTLDFGDELKGDVSVVLYSQQGQRIFEKNFTVNAMETTQLDMQSVPKGIYFLAIYSDSKKGIIQLVK